MQDRAIQYSRDQYNTIRHTSLKITYNTIGNPLYAKLPKKSKIHILYTIKTQKRVYHPLLHGIYELFAQIKIVSNVTF